MFSSKASCVTSSLFLHSMLGWSVTIDELLKLKFRSLAHAIFNGFVKCFALLNPLGDVKCHQGSEKNIGYL